MLNLPNFESKWTKCVKEILNEIGRPDIWQNQNNIQCKTLKNIVKQTLLDQNYQNWELTLQNSTKGLNYAILKESISLEPYLLKLNKNEWKYLLKFRTGNHFFPSEAGRWSNIQINERRCNFCTKQDLADEFHYLFQCPYFHCSRKKFIKPYFYKRPNMIKFKELLSSESTEQLHKLCKFLKILFDTIKN